MNNRQSGRRRGRGGQRPQGGPGRPEQGNRIDNRARGNASQLLEKYKTLARDAQTQGDRVMTEYYLQFADHYFRVLSESRARFEENQNRHARNDFQDDEDEGEGEELRGDAGADAEDGEGERQPRFNDRPERAPRQERPRREDREPREAREPREGREPREAREPRERRPRQEPVRAEAEEVIEQPVEEKAAARSPRGGLRPRRNGAANGHAVADANGIDADRLPPSFNFGDEQPAPAVEAEAEAEAAPAPKRRGRPRKVVEAPAEG